MTDRDHLGKRPGPDSDDIPDIIRRVRARRAAHHQRHLTYRIVYALAGFTVTFIGIAIIVTPGPSSVVIPLGLAMLALEFAWAERVLHKAVEQADLAKQRAAELSRTEQVLTGITIFLAFAAFVAAAVIWDIPVLPF